MHDLQRGLAHVAVLLGQLRLLLRRQLLLGRTRLPLRRLLLRRLLRRRCLLLRRGGADEGQEGGGQQVTLVHAGSSMQVLAVGYVYAKTWRGRKPLDSTSRPAPSMARGSCP